MGFLLGALGRRRKLWLTLGAVGLVLGAGLYLHEAPSYPASTTVLLVYGPNQDPQQQIFTEVAIAQSTAVAAAVVSELGLSEPLARSSGPTRSPTRATRSSTSRCRRPAARTR